MARSAAPFPPASGPTLAAGRVRPRMALDLATVLGLGGAFAMVVLTVIMGGSPGAFFDLASLLLVGGGTVAVTTVSFSLTDMAGVSAFCLRTLVRTLPDPRAVARQMLLLAEAARKSEAASLRGLLPELRSDPFLHRCVTLITEGLTADDVEQVLAGEAEAAAAAQAKGIGVLRRAADVAPAMGLIGTLIGLVQMLGNLENPSTIGPSMAVALLTTFYGAILGSMVLSPLAGKLERNSDEESVVKTLYLIGAVSIARQENPRRLEMLLNTVLPPGKRVQYFDR